MNKKLKEAIDYIKKLEADYGDIRMKDISTEQIKMENGKIADLSVNRSYGAGIRLYVNGAMGFAATSDINNIKEAVKLAYDTALASSTLLRRAVKLSPKKAHRAEYATSISIDPYTVPIKEKIDVLTAVSKGMNRVCGLSGYESGMDFKKEDVIFADTDDSFIKQTFFWSGGQITARALGAGDIQQRSYGNTFRAGYEAVCNLKLPEYAKTVAGEAVLLSKAENCPAGEFDVILAPTQLNLQIHESVGHPTELDRVLGSEAAFAGASFLLPGDFGVKYGSQYVTIEADCTNAFGYDDEGVPAQNITLIDKGNFKNFQTSRDNAPIIGQNSCGMGIADGWGNLPIVRMANVNLRPGLFTLDALIGGIKKGFLLEQNKSWSIDDKRVNFQFACEIAREIVNGKLTGKIFKNPIYTGKTTEFWNSCDGVCNEKYRQVICVPNCGKGQPLQIVPVCHASSPARFRKVSFVSGG